MAGILEIVTNSAQAQAGAKAELGNCCFSYVQTLVRVTQKISMLDMSCYVHNHLKIGCMFNVLILILCKNPDDRPLFVKTSQFFCQLLKMNMIYHQKTITIFQNIYFSSINI